jgi:hypothetical protein
MCNSKVSFSNRLTSPATRYGTTIIRISSWSTTSESELININMANNHTMDTEAEAAVEIQMMEVSNNANTSPRRRKSGANTNTNTNNSSFSWFSGPILICGFAVMTVTFIIAVFASLNASDRVTMMASQQEATTFSKSKASKAPKADQACKISNLRECCLQGNAAVCIIDFNCSYDRCGTCPKSLFNDCCRQTQLADLVFCQTQLGCDLTQCGSTKRPNKKKPNKKKKNKRKLLVEAVKSNGEGIKRIYQ